MTRSIKGETSSSMAKLIPGTLQCINIGEYLPHFKNNKDQNLQFATLIAELELMTKNKILVFNKKLNIPELAENIYNKKVDYHYQQVLEKKLLNIDDRHIKAMALRSKIIMYDDNHFNMRSVQREAMKFQVEHKIDVIVLEGISIDDRKKDKLIMLAMRVKCVIININSKIKLL